MKNTIKNMKRKNAGFTLLELVVVVAVMGLISTMAMDVYTDHSNQKRFDATKERLAEIKFAIIGDPMMRVGSQAITEGNFFKDMGRFPKHINELISKDTNAFCLHNTNNSVASMIQVACNADPDHTWTLDDSTNWKGPYLHNVQAINNSFSFGDGWGNDDGNNNFGWVVSIDGSDNFVVLSEGLDRNPGGLEYNADQSAKISQNELSQITYLSAFPSPTQPSYCIDTTSSAINFSYTEPVTCTAVATRIWVVFP